MPRPGSVSGAGRGLARPGLAGKGALEGRRSGALAVREALAPLEVREALAALGALETLTPVGGLDGETVFDVLEALTAPKTLLETLLDEEVFDGAVAWRVCVGLAAALLAVAFGRVAAGAFGGGGAEAEAFRLGAGFPCVRRRRASTDNVSSRASIVASSHCASPVQGIGAEKTGPAAARARRMVVKSMVVMKLK